MSCYIVRNLPPEGMHLTTNTQAVSRDGGVDKIRFHGVPICAFRSAL